MPTKYTERLRLPVDGQESFPLFTACGLNVAKGYKRIVFIGNKPFLEFSDDQLNGENILIPDNQKWRIHNPSSSYIEYRSKDYCNIKIRKHKEEYQIAKRGMFYISPFDLVSSDMSVLIDPLKRKQNIFA